ALDRARAAAAATRIAADVELCRRWARQTSASASMEFTAAEHRYVLPDVPDLNHAGTDYAVALSDEPYESQLAAVEFDDSTTLRFDGFGVPVGLTAPGKIVVRSGSHERTVLIDPHTGRASIQ
ncbi:MAG: hypothetical protein ACREIV_00230, partial [Planctomycetaceae bacterium]